MSIFSTIEDDFPGHASSVVDARRYYEAFLKADSILASAPKRYREDAENRLPELMGYIYRGGDTSSALYRKKDDSSDVLVGVWLSAVRRTAGWYVAANAPPAFEGLPKPVLADLPRRFCDPATLKEIGPFLSGFGIVLVLEEVIPGMKLDGSVFALPSGHMVVAMSLRYSRLYYFWFTLLHELAHISLHAEHLNTPIVDDLDGESDSLIEKQADRLALDSLIPRSDWRSCPARYSNGLPEVIDFAGKMGIPPECVAGRLRFELNKYDLFAELVNRHNVREILGVG